VVCLALPRLCLGYSVIAVHDAACRHDSSYVVKAAGLGGSAGGWVDQSPKCNDTQHELPYLVPHPALRLNGQAAYTDADVTVDQVVRLGRASLAVLGLLSLLGSKFLLFWKNSGARFISIGAEPVLFGEWCDLRPWRLGGGRE
jgi:hypothetical protein